MASALFSSGWECLANAAASSSTRSRKSNAQSSASLNVSSSIAGNVLTRRRSPLRVVDASTRIPRRSCSLGVMNFAAVSFRPDSFDFLCGPLFGLDVANANIFPSHASARVRSPRRLASCCCFTRWRFASLSSLDAMAVVVLVAAQSAEPRYSSTRIGPAGFRLGIALNFNRQPSPLAHPPCACGSWLFSFGQRSAWCVTCGSRFPCRPVCRFLSRRRRMTKCPEKSTRSRCGTVGPCK